MTPVFIRAQFNPGSGQFDVTFGPQEFSQTPEKFREMIEGFREARRWANREKRNIKIALESPEGTFRGELSAIQVARVLEYLETVEDGFRSHFGLEG